MPNNTGSASSPPPGVVPNFDNPNSLYPVIEATITLCFILTTLFTAARLSVKPSISPYRLILEDCM